MTGLGGTNFKKVLVLIRKDGFVLAWGNKVGWVGWMSSREVQINVAAEGYQVKKAFILVTTPLGLKYSCCDAAYIFCKCFYFFLSLVYHEVH